MLPGYNTDFKYRGETYHVQTEDNGVSNPFVVSLLYFKGAILASRKTSYRDLVGLPDQAKQLAELMKAQHKALMRELLAGAFDATIGPAAQAVAAATLPGDGAPAAAPPPAPAAAPRVSPASLVEPEEAPVAAVAGAVAPAAAPPSSHPAPPLESLPLDEAIHRYLREYAAAAAGGAAA